MKALSVMFQWLVVVLAAALPVLIVAGVVVAIVIWVRRIYKRREREHLAGVRQGNREQNRELLNRDVEAPIAPAEIESDTENDNK